MLPLRPEHCAAVYDALRAFPPFSRWSLPESDEIEFVVNLDPKVYGACEYYSQSGQTTIKVSAANVGHWNTLGMYIAHEMIHLYQYRRKSARHDVEHDAAFKRMAKAICGRFGWDARAF